MKSRNGKVLLVLGTNQLSQKFLVALSMYTYSLRDRYIRNAMRITFKDVIPSIVALIAGSYIQRLLAVHRK